MLEDRTKINIEMVCDLVDGYLLALPSERQYYLSQWERLLEICQCQCCKAIHL